MRRAMMAIGLIVCLSVLSSDADAAKRCGVRGRLLQRPILQRLFGRHCRPVPPPSVQKMAAQTDCTGLFCMKTRVMVFVDENGDPLFARYIARECYKEYRNYDDTDTNRSTCDCVAADDQCIDECEEDVPDYTYAGYSVSESLESGLSAYPQPQKGSRNHTTHVIRFEVAKSNADGDATQDPQPAAKRTVLAHVLDVQGQNEPVYIGYEIESTTANPIDATVEDASAGFCVQISFTPENATEPVTTTVLLVSQKPK